ncbi:50S ribosomal protein L24 [Candidatus Dojkabacteria bacterium]|jgi:large subunit ribosomal protein L24|nr:50S ribosomal protein L24 [Candidatus Dojkabacteria bacterium]
MKIKKGDKVKVLYGKDAGKTGNVLAVLQKEKKVVVSEINKAIRHIKGDGKSKKSEIINVERPMPISKVMVICPNCSKPTRVKVERRESGYIRICKKCKKEFAKGIVKEEVKEKKEVKKIAKKETKKKVIKKTTKK